MKITAVRSFVVNAKLRNWIFVVNISTGNLNFFQSCVLSGAGKVEHFSGVFEKTKAEAALAAGIFHREEVPIEAVKEHMREKGIETR